MKLPSFKRLFTTDFDEEYQDLVNKISASLNDGFENVYNALNRRLTLEQNIACTVRDFPVTVDADGEPLTDTFVKLDNTLPILGTSIIKATNQINPNTYPTGQPFVIGELTNSGWRVLNVSGLQANQPYILKVILWN